MDAFFESVYRVVGRIPYGRVASYGQVALLAGNPRAARQVGRAMRVCPDDLPWQRVVKADGTIAGGLHAAHRRGMLEAEGVPMVFWVDDAGLPLAMESEGGDGLSLRYRFEFDVALPAGYLSSEVPDGYTLAEPDPH